MIMDAQNVVNGKLKKKKRHTIHETYGYIIHSWLLLINIIVHFVNSYGLLQAYDGLSWSYYFLYTHIYCECDVSGKVVMWLINIINVSRDARVMVDLVVSQCILFSPAFFFHFHRITNMPEWPAHTKVNNTSPVFPFHFQGCYFWFTSHLYKDGSSTQNFASSHDFQ